MPRSTMRQRCRNEHFKATKKKIQTRIYKFSKQNFLMISLTFYCVFQDLVRILYVGENTQHLHAEGDKGDSARADGKAGIRVLGISPDGQHLAAGDRCGNLQ